MLQVNVDDVESAIASLQGMINLSTNVQSDSQQANQRFLDGNHGDFADAEDETFFMLETVMGAYIDALGQFQGNLKDAYQALIGDIWKDRDNLVVVLNGALRNPKVVTHDQSFNGSIDSQSTVASGDADTLMDKILSAIDSAGGLDAGGPEREQILSSLWGLYDSASSQGTTCSDIGTNWDLYTSETDSFTSNFSSKFSGPFIDETEQQNAVNAMNKKLVDHKAGGIANQLKKLISPSSAGSWWETGDWYIQLYAKYLSRISKYVDDPAKMLEVNSILGDLKKSFTKFNPFTYRKNYDPQISPFSFEDMYPHTYWSQKTQKALSVSRKLGKAGKALGYAGAFLSEAGVVESGVRSFQTAQGDNGKKLAAAGATVAKGTTKVAIGVAASSVGTTVGENLGGIAATAIVAANPEVLPLAPVLYAGLRVVGGAVGGVAGGWIGDKLSGLL